MPRRSAFRGTFSPNNRPYVTVAPDAYVAIQGQTNVITCGECNRKLDLNKYITGINSEANVESAPGTATINMSIPDNDVNNFYVDGQFVLISMMEIEIYSKGYYVVGGTPQYYRTFWGLINNVQTSWSAGSTTVTISCRDILRWWELTNVIVNPAFLDIPKTSSGYNLFQNQFSGMNPYTVIIALAKEAMGDFSITTGSFTSFRPEDGPERQVIASFSKDIMSYWQLKFGNIWNSLVLFGTSGQAYTFSGDAGNVSPYKIAKKIFEEEARQLSLNPETASFKNQPHEIAAFKREVARAGEVDFFQNETQSKLAIANTCRDQAGGYEFYCDTTGDIIFKPPFYNLNVMPNKPVSWINDFEIIDDSITESEQEVYTHITSSGNAFGGVTDWGINDDITTPRTGVIDYHLLKRYGWRRLDVQVQWAGNPRKLFFHLLDWLDRVNAKRESGTITIPYRPEIRMGFPCWIPKYDSFFYIQGISHQYSPGGQATTTLTLIAKRSKFIAPKNIGTIEVSGKSKQTFTNPVTKKKEVVENPSYSITFPSDVGANAGIVPIEGQSVEYGGPAVLRNPKTGKLVGYPNAVMVYRTTISGKVIQRLIEQSGSTKQKNPKKQEKRSAKGTTNSYDDVQKSILSLLQTEERSKIIDQLRLHRYESGMSNAGVYDYAHDVGGYFKEFAITPTDSIIWGAGGQNPDDGTEATDNGPSGVVDSKFQKSKTVTQRELNALGPKIVAAKKILNDSIVELNNTQSSLLSKSNTVKTDNVLTNDEIQNNERVDSARSSVETAQSNLNRLLSEQTRLRSSIGSLKRLKSLNIMIRPVSDEFGFEVIGHNRYGRGAFIDRGQVQIADPNESENNPNFANQIGIQFASHGGLLTDNPIETNVGQQSKDFAQLFEKMTDEDYTTGASFTGANYSNENTLKDVNFTGQNTYQDSINASVTRADKAVFVESDALKRAKFLEELHPTLNSGLDDIGFTNCNCGIGRTEWLTILPEETLREILNPLGSAKSENLKFSDNGQARPSTSTTEATGTSIPPRLQSAFQSASNGVFDPISVDDIFSPDEITVALGSDAVDEAKLQAAKQTSQINALLEQSSRGIVSSFASADFNPDIVGGIDPGEIEFYGNDIAVQVKGSGVPRSNSDSSTVDSYALGPIGSQKFFEKLSIFMQEKFSLEYDESNEKREKFATTGSTNNVRAADPGLSSNILQDQDVFGDRINSLANRASQGDPDALSALQNEANFNFGLTKQGIEKFKDQSASVPSNEPRLVSATPKFVPTPPQPVIGDLINPRSVPTVDTQRISDVNS